MRSLSDTPVHDSQRYDPSLWRNRLSNLTVVSPARSFLTCARVVPPSSGWSSHSEVRFNNSASLHPSVHRRDVVADRALFRFALLKRALRLYLFGDIAVRADQTHGLAVRVAL